MIGIYERVETILNEEHRHRHHECAPIWKVKGETEKIPVHFFKMRLPAQAEQVNVIHSTKQWLNLWKEIEHGTFVCTSNALNHHYIYSRPDHAFDLRPIATFPELIAIIKHVLVPIPYDSNERPYWETLWELLQKNTWHTFEDIVTHAVNRQTIRLDETASLWLNQADPFRRWLLKWYVKNQTAWNASYLAYILGSLATCDSQEFINAFWLKIFDTQPIQEQWIQERKASLQSISTMPGVNTAELETVLEQRLHAVSDIFQHVELLTGITVAERRLAMRFVEECHQTRKQVINVLQRIYPHLADYLSDIICDDMTPEKAWVQEYFDEYRWSKILHQKTDRLTQLLNEKNANKETFYEWYHSFPSAHALLEKARVKTVFWIDGLGIEWLPLLTRLIEAHGLLVEKKFLARANLPTITSCNRFEQATHLRDLDAFIHGKTQYAHPDDLIHEMDIVAEIVNASLLTNERILVVSDHGFTAFAIPAFGNQKRYAFENADHDGRCLRTDMEVSDDDFLVHESADGEQREKTVMALRHVSLYNVPRREVHGGATPEEVLVPVIIIAKSVPSGSETYIVTPLKQTVSIKTPVCKFDIQPTPSVRPKLRHANNIIELEYLDAENNNIWTARMEHVKTGTYHDMLEIGTWRTQITLIIKGGMQTKDIL